MVLGCGYLGLGLSRFLTQEGLVVWGVRRNSACEPDLKAAGARPVFADLSNFGALKVLPKADDIVACVSPGPADDYRKTYVEIAKALVCFFAHHSPRRFFVGVKHRGLRANPRGMG